MRTSMRWTAFLLLAACLPARAQTGEPSLPREGAAPVTQSTPAPSNPTSQGPFFGGAPVVEAQPGVLKLSIADAVKMALRHNLGLLLAEQGTRQARGERWKELANLLPNVGTTTSETVQQISLQAFGFPGLPGIPNIIGPFSVFDTRAYLSQSVLNLNSINRMRESSENLKAAEFSLNDARDLVVLVASNLYFEARAGESRMEAARVQVKTAQALYDRAVDQKKAGVIPAIDVLRSQVELQAQQQRVIFFENEFEKEKLNLARAIGLPVGQAIELSDPMPTSPPPPFTLDEALRQAFDNRGDYKQAQALVRAAQAARRAARGNALPALRFNANYGDIGLAPGASHGTFAVIGSLDIPLFQGGRVHGEMLQADALLSRRESELADLRNRIEYEVRTALLDLKASGDQVKVAQSAQDLAHQQLQQAQDRFSAGVVNSIEVVQAQEAVATADENYISSLYRFNLAKGALLRAMGTADETFEQYLGGKP